ncbi:MAG: HAD family hydrolase [Candidatus Aenigmatarchaeota archaeon]
MSIDPYQIFLNRVIKEFEPRTEFYFYYQRSRQYFLTDNYPPQKPLKCLILDVDGTISPNLTAKWIEGLMEVNSQMKEYERELFEGLKLLQENNILKGIQLIHDIFTKSDFNLKQYEASAYYAVDNGEWYRGVKEALKNPHKYGYFIMLDTGTPDLVAKLAAEKLGIPKEFAEGSYIIFDDYGRFKDIKLNVDAEKKVRKERILNKYSFKPSFNIVIEDDPVQNISYLINGGINPIILVDFEKTAGLKEKLSSYALIYPQLREDFTKLWPLVLRLERWFLLSLTKSEDEMQKILSIEKELQKKVETARFCELIYQLLKLLKPFFPENYSGIKDLVLELFISDDSSKRDKILHLINKYTELLI